MLRLIGNYESPITYIYERLSYPFLWYNKHKDTLLFKKPKIESGGRKIMCKV